MVLVSSPGVLSFSGNLPKIVISATPTEVLDVVLKKGAEVILEELYRPDSNGKIEIDYRAVIDGLLNVEMPSFLEHNFLQTGAVATFNVVITDNASATETVSFKVIKGGVAGVLSDQDVFIKTNFLTWQEQTKIVKFYDPEFLTYYASQLTKVKLKGYFADQAPINIDYGDVNAGELATLNLNYGHVSALLGKNPLYYDVWAGSDVEVFTFVQRYVYSDKVTEYENTFLFENSCGGIDTIKFTGELEEKNIAEFSTAVLDEVILDYDIKAEKSYTVNSGFFRNERHRQWSLEFLTSLQKYFLTEGSLIRIFSNQPESKNLTGELASYEIDFILSKQSKYLNLNRSDQPLPNLQIDTQLGEVFFLAPRLTELPWANNEDSLIPVQYPYESFWRKISLKTILSSIGGLVSTLHALTAGYATNAGRALVSDKALDSDKWNNNEFPDYLDQPVRTTDNVKFASVEADMVNSSLYVSGFTGSGYRINPDGSAEFDSLSVRKELNVNVLNIREITGSGGSLAITSVAKILNVIDGGSYWRCEINTDDGTIAVQLRANDIVRCQIWDGKNIKYYSTTVTSVGTDYFNLSKADKVGGGIPEAKDTVFQFGNKDNLNRQGLIYLTNSDTGAPYLDVLDGVNSSDLTGKTKVRLGKLDGINDPDFGQLEGYGIYGENVYLKNGKFKGEIEVTGGNAQTIQGSQDQIDAISFGGRNLLLNSGDINGVNPIPQYDLLPGTLPFILN